MMLRREDFAGWRINWNDKAENIARCWRNVGLGAESAVFIDDSPIERGACGASRARRSSCPNWPDDPARYPRGARLAALLRRADRSRKEDRRRTAMYAAERARKASVAGCRQPRTTGSQSLGVTVTVGAAGPGESRTRRAAVQQDEPDEPRDAAAVEAGADAVGLGRRARALLTFRVADRFGDSGLTGIVGLEHDGAGGTTRWISCSAVASWAVRSRRRCLHVAVVPGARAWRLRTDCGFPARRRATGPASISSGDPASARSAETGSSGTRCTSRTTCPRGRDGARAG